jgi:hypothetical protein
LIASVALLHCPLLFKINWTYLDFVSNNASAADKAPAATAAPLTAVTMEDDKDKQGFSPHLSPTRLSNIVKDIIGLPLAPKNQQSTIRKQRQ